MMEFISFYFFIVVDLFPAKMTGYTFISMTYAIEM